METRFVEHYIQQFKYRYMNETEWKSGYGDGDG